MIAKEVQVTNVKTMADGTIRLSIDILAGNGDDIKEAYNLTSQDTTMYLGTTQEFAQIQQDNQIENDLS